MDDESHTINMVMHVRSRAMRASVRQNKRHDKTDHIKSLVQDALNKHITKQGALTDSEQRHK